MAKTVLTRIPREIESFCERVKIISQYLPVLDSLIIDDVYQISWDEYTYSAYIILYCKSEQNVEYTVNLSIPTPEKKESEMPEATSCTTE